MLIVLGFVEVLTRQRILFASLASSAFLIYLDPEHGTNSVRSLVISHLSAAVVGFSAHQVLGSGYLSAGSAMLVTIVLMILLDVVHPPAIASSLAFAFRAEDERNVVLFGLAVAVIATLVLVERGTLYALSHFRAGSSSNPSRQPEA